MRDRGRLCRRIAWSLALTTAWLVALPSPAGLAMEIAVERPVAPRDSSWLTLRLQAPRSARAEIVVRDRHGHVVARGRTTGRGAGQDRQVRLHVIRPALLGSCRSVRLTATLSSRGERSVRDRLRSKLDPVRCAALRWSSPALRDPKTIRLRDGFAKLDLDAGRDYVIALPAERRVGGAFIEGGRNVRIVGGHITLPVRSDGDEDRRALYFKGQTGTVHVEGVLIDGSGGGQGDGIAINAPQAVVQIENVRIVGLHGSERGTHADVVQPWGGVRELRVDRLTGSSHFQGLQLPVANGPIGQATVSQADLTALAPEHDGGGGDMLWLTPSQSCVAYPVTLVEAYVRPRSRRALDETVRPGLTDPEACRPQRQGGALSWPGLPVAGQVLAGRPPGGDFVPRRLVGTGYRSPGYVRGARATRHGCR